MKTCNISVYLAYSMATYILASLYYMIATQFVGTPFKNSLTAKQIKIKNKSVIVRRNIFYQGIAVSIVSLAIFKPFHKC